MRGRFAPSPSGRMHLGNVCTAMLAWLQVRQAQGTMVLRIEDIDRRRSRRAFEQEIISDLKWLGLHWDEGPQMGGDFGPYHQSKRDSQYQLACARVETYPCFCTRKILRERIQHFLGGEPIYDGYCRRNSVAGERGVASLRWKTPKQIVKFEDLVFGKVEQDVREQVGEFVIRSRDTSWAYQFAVVVDDAAMKVSHVFRGRDLLNSTPRQILLQRSLGFPEPTYAHAPLILGPDGKKLSKRHLSYDLGMIRQSGIRPERILAILAAALGLIPKKTQSIVAQELVGEFSIDRLPKASFPLDLSRFSV